MNYAISFSFHLAGKYDYQYVERQREGEKDEDGFSSRSGQRTMNKDIIKEEVVMAQGTLYLLQISFQPLILSVFFCYVGLFPVGCYAYPFSYQLPHSLPGEVLGHSLTVYLTLLSPCH